MTNLEERLREVPDSYHSFVVAALTYGELLGNKLPSFLLQPPLLG